MSFPRKQVPGFGAILGFTAVWLIGILAFWGTLIYVAAHFISKFW